MDDLNAYLLQKYGGGGGGQQQPPSQQSANQQQPPSSFDQTNPSIVALLQHRQELELRQQLLALQEAKLQQQHDVHQALQAAAGGSTTLQADEEHRLLSSRVAQLEGTYNNRQHVQDDLRTRLEQELLKRKATELLLQRGAAAGIQQPEEKQPAGVPRAIPHSMGGGVSTSLQPPTAKGKHNIPPDVKEQEKIRLRQDILQQQLREQQTLLTNSQQHGTELDTYQYKLQLLKQLEQSRQLKLDAAVARLLPNNNPTPPITNTTTNHPTVNSQGAIVTSPNTGGRWDHGGHGNTYTLMSPNNVRVGDNSFPSKLHEVLAYCERANLTHVISWLPHGTCLFCSVLLGYIVCGILISYTSHNQSPLL